MVLFVAQGGGQTLSHLQPLQPTIIEVNVVEEVRFNLQSNRGC